jgi:hypothetical protein
MPTEVGIHGNFPTKRCTQFSPFVPPDLLCRGLSWIPACAGMREQAFLSA